MAEPGVAIAAAAKHRHGQGFQPGAPSVASVQPALARRAWITPTGSACGARLLAPGGAGIPHPFRAAEVLRHRNALILQNALDGRVARSGLRVHEGEGLRAQIFHGLVRRIRPYPESPPSPRLLATVRFSLSTADRQPIRFSSDSKQRAESPCTGCIPRTLPVAVPITRTVAPYRHSRAAIFASARGRILRQHPPYFPSPATCRSHSNSSDCVVAGKRLKSSGDANVSASVAWSRAYTCLTREIAARTSDGAA